MRFSEEAEFAAFIGRDQSLLMVTPDAVAQSMTGFALPLLHSKTTDWLAMAVRRALAISLPDESDGPERTSNLDIRNELERLAALAESAWLDLYQCDDAAESRLWHHAWRYDKIADGQVLGEPRDYHRFKAAIAELDWMAGFMREAAKEIPRQLGPWRQSEAKQLRVKRGYYLAPIFESAFGHPVSANNYPTDPVHKFPTPFMDFYCRMIALAFGGRETANMTEVVKAACRLHRQQPARFPEGIIPHL